MIIFTALLLTSTIHTVQGNAVPTHLSDEDAEEVLGQSDHWHEEYAGDMYRRWDTNGDGVIRRSEFVVALMKDWELEVWELVDTDKDGYVDHNKVRMFFELIGPEESMRSDADTGGDGKISEKEARAFTKDFFGEEVFDEFDTSGDGKIDIHELAQYMSDNSDKENMEMPENMDDMDFGDMDMDFGHGDDGDDGFGEEF